MDQRFVILDNHSYVVPVMKSLLRQLGYESKDIWPDTARIFNDWTSVFDELASLQNQGWDPEQQCCVLLLDLALDDHDNSYSEGLARISQVATTLLEHYVKIVHTLYPTQIDSEFKRTSIDAVIDKRDTQNKDSRAGKIALRTGISVALRNWEKRTGREAPNPPRFRWRLVDSPSARRAEAALGYEGVSELAERLAERWSDVLVTVLTGGYSGSYLLKVEGREGASRRSVVCKIAREREMLEQEIDSWKMAASNYNTFIGLIPPVVESQIQRLGTRGDAWFIVQSTVPGHTLEDAVKQASVDGVLDAPTIKAEFGPVLHRLFKMSEAGLRSTLDNGSTLTRLYLTDLDTERFESSMPQLLELARVCVDKGYIDETSFSQRAATEFQIGIVGDWKNAIRETGLATLPFHDQHGDLNPRNIILSGGTPQLIDFARFGNWPVGYDLIRLQMQLLLRLIDSVSMNDSFPHNLREWLVIWRLITESSTISSPPADDTSTGLTTICLWMVNEINRYLRDLFAMCPEPHIDLRRCAHLIRVFEAIRMCSYQDASWFKRLWFLLLAIDSAEAAGLR